MWPYLIGFGLLAGLAAVMPTAPAPGMAATDVLPPGWSGAPALERLVKPEGTGRVYRVKGWPPNKQNEDYFVAQRDGDPHVWVAWIHDRATDKRRLYRAAANSDAERDQLLSDFKVDKQ